MAVTPLRRDDKPAAGSGLAARLAIRGRDASRPDRRAGARLCAGQSRHFAAGARRRFPALLPAQSQALPADRDIGAGRLRACRNLARISTSAPTCRAIASGRMASWLPSRGRPRILARRSRELRDRLLVFVRGSADGGRHRAAPHRARLQRADVSHLDRDARGRAVPRADGGVDAAAEARRRDPRGADHHALSVGARRAGAYRQAGTDRHQRYRQARLRRRRRRCATTRCRCSGPAGSRRSR